MKVVVGLGNPGLKYRHTRHNVGFEVVGELARRHGAAGPRVKFEAEVAEVVIASVKTLLVAPQTYMNLSGRSVRRVADFYQLSLEDLLVVCDDMNLKLGQLRLRRSGSDGGQKGIRSIIDHLGVQEFARLRLGIDPPPEQFNAADYVLSRFRDDEVDVIRSAVGRAATAVELWIREGVESAMNHINAPPPG